MIIIVVQSFGNGNEKKTIMGWGEAGSFKWQSLNDEWNPKHPSSPEYDQFYDDDSVNDNTKTLEQYLEEKKSLSPPILLPEPRKPNEGSDHSQWKNTVAIQKKEENYFIGKDGGSFKYKNKPKKGKVYLNPNPVSRHSLCENIHGINHRNRQHGKRREQVISLFDVSAFPILGT
ncbi:hypothetical protein G6F53_007410 [Rhizopus delemar]|nr:hypothetical protein G6F53_007410 [Rhizopus delemar]